MKCRKNVKDLDAIEKKAYVDAVIALKDAAQAPSIIPEAQADGAESRYDDYVWMHQVALNPATSIHNGPAFGPWHREFMRHFEHDLRIVVNDDSITIPYWDWTLARQPGDDGWPFTDTDTDATADEFLGGFGTGVGGAVETGLFAFAKGNWNINIKDRAVEPDFLTRAAAPDPTTVFDPNGPPFLPIPSWAQLTLGLNPYDDVPFNEDPRTIPWSEIEISFRKLLELLLHNPVHNWVDGNMMTAASPNDPVFFLHHAAIDRLWSIWQDKFPNEPDFAPDSGANAGHNSADDMSVTDQTFFNYGVPPMAPLTVMRKPNEHLDLHSTGVWYDSDLPVVSLDTLSVEFGEVPEDLTTYRPVRLTVEGCREVRIRVTAVGGSGFDVPPGQELVIVPGSDDPSPREVAIHLSFDAEVALAAGAFLDQVVPGSAVVQAFIVDNEGYFANAVGGEFTIPTWSWTIDLSATPVERERSAVAFVSDRSGSMSLDAGGGINKFTLLTDALEVVTDLMEPTDAVALVFFDDQVVTPLELSALVQSDVNSALADPDILPDSGRTAIGLGLIEGVAQLDDILTDPNSVYNNAAVVCLTDGNENETPYVTHTPVTDAVAALNGALYAIGFGTANNVSADTLGEIADYMLITGEMTGAQRTFLVTKYFVQILAGIKGNEIIVDPDGSLKIGSQNDIPFDVSEADVGIEVVVLSPLAPFIEVSVVTPGGTVIEAPALGPNAIFTVNRKDTFLRIKLPALPGDIAGSQAGRWTARLRLSRERIEAVAKKLSARSRTELRSSAEFTLRSALDLAKGALPYSVIIQTRSNLRLHVSADRTAVRPGEMFNLVTALSQYGIPMMNRPHITTSIRDPLGHVTEHEFHDIGAGLASVQVPTPLKGVYSCRIKVRGQSLGGRTFMREQTRTFAVTTAPPSPALPSPETGSIPDAFCNILQCLVEDRGIRRILESAGVDVNRLSECLEDVCKKDTPQPPSTAKPKSPKLEPCPPLLTARAVSRESFMAAFRAPEPLPRERPKHPTPATGMVMPLAGVDAEGKGFVRVMASMDPNAAGRGDRYLSRSVQNVRGIGRSFAARLREHEIILISQLIACEAELLAEILKVGMSRASAILRAAHEGEVDVT